MKAATFLGELFNVRAGEWRRLSVLYAMSLIAITGLYWGDAIVQAGFLQRIGVQYLPWVFVSSAACSFVALFVYSAFADRVSNTRLLVALLALSCVGIGLGLALLAAGLVLPAYLLLYLVLNVPLLDVYNVHWATYVNGFYDIRAAKRIVPVLGSASRCGGIIAGLSMPLMNRALSPAAILLVMVLGLVVMAAMAAATPHLMPEPKGAAAAERPIPPTASIPTRDSAAVASNAPGLLQRLAGGHGANLREGYMQIARSPFLVWMALSTLSMTVLLALLNYQTSAVFQAELKTTAAISNFMGFLSGVANLAVMPIQLILLSRLMARFGLGNISLIYPLVSVGAATGLVVAPSLATSAVAYVDRGAVRAAFRLPTDNLLYNAVPLRVRARTRAFVSGLLVPLGTIIGGILLLTPLKRYSWFLPAAILALAAAFMVAALLVRRQYARALLALLEREDFSSLTQQELSLDAPILPLADGTTLDRLAEKLRESANHERTVFLAHLIAEIAGERATPILARAAREATDGRLRAALIDVLVASDARRGGVRELYTELLTDLDRRVRLSAIAGLEQIDGPGDHRYLVVATGLLADPDIAVRLRVLPALLAADDPAHRAAGADELETLLKARNPHTRARALDVVAQMRSSQFLLQVVRSLTAEADGLRLAAALAAERLAGDEAPPGNRAALLAPMLALLHDPIERVRLATVTVLGKLSRDGDGDAESALSGLAEALGDPSREVREAAAEALVRADQQAVRLAREQLSATNLSLRSMAAVVLARIEPRKYAPLVSGPILNAILSSIYRNLGCLHALVGYHGAAPRVLARALRERNAAQLDEIFHLLGEIRDAAAVKTIAGALHSPDPAVRANAAEALESLTASRTAALVAPLFEPDLPQAQLASLLKQSGDMSMPTAVDALRLLLSDAGDTCVRTLAAAVLVEFSELAGPLSQAETAELLALARTDPDEGVRAEANRAAGDEVSASRSGLPGRSQRSLVEKLIPIMEVPFFRSLTVDQMVKLACVCEEEHHPQDTSIFDEGDVGGAFYMVVAGRVGIERKSQSGARTRLAVVDAGRYFGESELFGTGRRSAAAIALQDTLTLRLRSEPLLELARRNPDISLHLIDALARQLRETNDQISGLARSRPRELHRLFDSFDLMEGDADVRRD